MARLLIFLGPVLLLVWVFCVIDAILADEHRVRNLPKPAWVILVLLFPFVGSVAWLLAGRPRDARPPRAGTVGGSPGFPEYERPGRAQGITPQSDEEFLNQVRERAEEQRRAYREQQARERAEAEAAERERRARKQSEPDE